MLPQVTAALPQAVEEAVVADFQVLVQPQEARLAPLRALLMAEKVGDGGAAMPVGAKVVAEAEAVAVEAV